MKIKILLYILLLLLGVNGINAQQQYKSCLDGVARWSMLCECYDCSPYSIEIFTYGDTIINGISYKNIRDEYFEDFEETDINWKNHIPDLSDPSEYSYYIRENDDASQLYILYSTLYGSEEYLISDLNLQEGDEFLLPEIWRYLIFFGSATVDSVYIENGLKHIRFNRTFPQPGKVGSTEQPLTFIEGVGSNVGFFSLSGWQTVNCFQNQSLFYKNETTFCPCGYQGFGGDAIETVFSDRDYSLKQKEDGVEIHSSVENVQIFLYNINGQLYYKRNFPAGKELFVPTATFPKGVYIMKILNRKTNQTSIHKIIL
jgi:hypothetical protein